MERIETQKEEVVVISNIDELFGTDSAPALELTEDDLHIDICLEQSKHGPQLLARRGDGIEMNPIPYLERYVSEAETEGIQIPQAVKTAIMVRAPAIYDHYGSNQARLLMEKLY